MRKSCENCNAIGIAPFCDQETTSRKVIESEKVDKIILRRNKLHLGAESADNIYVVSAGVIFLETLFDGTKSYEILYPGSFFGGFGQTGHNHVVLVAESLCDSLVCEIQERTVLELINRNSKFIRKYLTMMGIYLHTIKSRGTEPGTVPLQSRLCKALYTDFKKRGQRYNNSLSVTKIMTHEEWGLYFGVRRESITRAFKDLEARGIISMENSLIVLRNEYELLRTIAEPSLKKTA